MTEFALNSSISCSTGFAPFELISRHMPMLMQHIKEGRPSTTPEVRTFVQQAISNLEMVHDIIIESQVVQMYPCKQKMK